MWPGTSPPSRVAIDIDMDSAATGIFPLTKHLKSADFFDVDHYPKASFASTRIQPSPTLGATHVLIGDFTLHGVTHTVSVPATLRLNSNELTLDSTFTIRQSDFGMAEAAKKTNDPVPITVHARLPLQ